MLLYPLLSASLRMNIMRARCYLGSQLMSLPKRISSMTHYNKCRMSKLSIGAIVYWLLRVLEVNQIVFAKYFLLAALLVTLRRTLKFLKQ